MQEFIVLLLFAGAIGYIGRLFYKSVLVREKSDAGCKGCPENIKGSVKK
jgi:hypothetical protein